MRIVTYNIAFGFNARSLLKSLLGHFCIHILRSPALVKLQSHFADQAIDLACSFSPDILCLNEVLPPFHGNELSQKLKRDGFRTIINAVSPSGNAEILGMHTVLALKANAEVMTLDLPCPVFMNEGKRAAAAYIPSQNLTIIAAHLSMIKPLRKKHLSLIKKFIDEQLGLKRDIIVAGDLNYSLEELEVLGLQGKRVATNLYPRCLRKLFAFAPDLDHILFSKKYSLIDTKTTEGYSDHKLLSCDLQG